MKILTSLETSKIEYYLSSIFLETVFIVIFFFIIFFPSLQSIAKSKSKLHDIIPTRNHPRATPCTTTLSNKHRPATKIREKRAFRASSRRHLANRGKRKLIRTCWLLDVPTGMSVWSVGEKSRGEEKGGVLRPGGANFPCNYARLLFIIMHTNGALRDSGRHSTPLQFQEDSANSPDLPPPNDGSWREMGIRSLLGGQREGGGGECNEDSSIHPHHRRLAPHLLICFLKSGGEDYLANHFG